MDQVAKGVPWSQVLVPIVLAFSDSVQFGAVYILPPSFPCAVMLSHPLSLLTWETRAEVSRWIRAIGLLCRRQADLVAKICPITRPIVTCRLDTGGLFLKPVSVQDPRTAGNAVAHLLRIFDLLSRSTSLTDCVVFPLGRMGLPSAAQMNMRRPVINTLNIPRFVNMTQDTDGWPIFIYPRLDNTWVEGSLCTGLHRYQEYVVQRLTTMLDAVEAAGVIHLDLRLSNVMVRMPVDTCVTGAVPELRLVDWDCSLRVGVPVPETLLLAFERDNRYPSGLTIATAAYHHFFINVIRETLRNAAVAAYREEQDAQDTARVTKMPRLDTTSQGSNLSRN
jgi:hypothetical protein